MYVSLFPSCFKNITVEHLGYTEGLVTFSFHGSPFHSNLVVTSGYENIWPEVITNELSAARLAGRLVGLQCKRKRGYSYAKVSPGFESRGQCLFVQLEICVP